MIEAERYMSMGGRHVMTSFVDMVWAITSKMLKAQSDIYMYAVYVSQTEEHQDTLFGSDGGMHGRKHG